MFLAPRMVVDLLDMIWTEPNQKDFWKLSGWFSKQQKKSFFFSRIHYLSWTTATTSDSSLFRTKEDFGKDEKGLQEL